MKRRTARVALECAILLVVAALLATGLKAFVAQAFYIPSASMEPQLQINDRVVVSRLAYDLHAPRRGDIVVFRAPPGLEKGPAPQSDPVLRALADAAQTVGLASSGTDLIKRVVALPGEAVEGRAGHVWIDDRILVEPYLPAGTLTSAFGRYVVPRGFVWVMGDNRDNSEDSRYFGAIPVSSIVGRAVWRVWPLTDLSFL
ncbi:MAG TPA: signal peptidase I [Acidimicrobiales bacterium]|jgi:signal peptidase I|nr:signal peptidase I [Acidimicrobiales bacterium]